MASSACKDAGLLRIKTVSLPRNSSLPRPRQICVGCASPAAGTAALKAYDKLQSEFTGPQARKLIDTFAIEEYVATKGGIQGLQQGLKDEFDSLRQLLKDQRIEDMQLLKDQRSEDIQRLKDQRSEDIQRLKDQRSEDTQHRKDQHNELTQQYNQLRLWFIFMTLAMLAFASVKPDTALGTILSFLPKLVFGKP